MSLQQQQQQNDNKNSDKNEPNHKKPLKVIEYKPLNKKGAKWTSNDTTQKANHEQQPSCIQLTSTIKEESSTAPIGHYQLIHPAMVKDKWTDDRKICLLVEYRKRYSLNEEKVKAWQQIIDVVNDQFKQLMPITIKDAEKMVNTLMNFYRPFFANRIVEESASCTHYSPLCQLELHAYLAYQEELKYDENVKRQAKQQPNNNSNNIKRRKVSEECANGSLSVTSHGDERDHQSEYHSSSIIETKLIKILDKNEETNLQFQREVLSGLKDIKHCLEIIAKNQEIMISKQC
ncbi:uncharacterized protein BX663DRAFT_505705 [Cokeromyces recurvatus]|uniref:uncharacterized protein n=1 Tax=Cokeromyces recurvatus TaxID=90255 RepID=UPI002220E950|nr:uncharacterized protein BX663DRAFT_505705 [Cokeromyces recurvatus]KAI7903925.1 hypothetical protein BX663DRAFT_505705 [Cokeromyces recurvatus]